jgi:hypothetical protein
MRAPGEQFQNALGSFGNDDLHGFFVTQSRAAGDGVLDMGFNAVLRLKDGGDSALGVPGVGLMKGVLGEKENVGALLSRGDGGAKTGYAAADDENIRELLGEAGGFERN